jgi:tRNA/tmRNA/rRNA uracil-C5-methylase (TrmA/RlmC/RlmD family)
MQFSQIIHHKIQGLATTAHPAPAVEPLAHLNYEQELTIKNHALEEFLHLQRLPLAPSSIVASPKPRHYRTTTKRQVMYKRGQTRLVFFYGDGMGAAHQTERSLLEPREHTALYSYIGDKLNEIGFRPLSEALNFVIIRGSYTQRTVIFNVHKLNGTVVKKINILAGLLPPLDRAVTSSFIFFDPGRSPYYLDMEYQEGSFKTKKLFGHKTLLVNFAGNKYLYDPTVFSQVNESMVPIMLATVKKFLAPTPQQHLIDLYCGYGLFTHFLASSYAHACGLEASPLAIESAQQNTRFFPSGNKVIFRVCRIADNAFLNLLPRPDHHAEVILADPPRKGLPPYVIASLARRAPVKILQACCGTDEIPQQVSAWQANGYQVTAVVPLDMFSGTPHLEILLLFEPIKNILI